MEHINVADLPEPVARAIEAMVEEIRKQLDAKPREQPSRELPRWEGSVIGTLSRKEIYDDVV
jgi:hypothetical protein